MRTLLLVLLFLLLATAPSAAGRTGTVSWVYDGDTLQIEQLGKVRLLGIDCPESQNSERDYYYLKRFNIRREILRQVAHRAKHFNIEQVKGKRVRLAFDRERTDKYGRLLAYLYLPDGRMLNRLLLENGLASVFRRFEFSRKEQFLQLEKQARDNQVGLWQQ